MKTATTAALMLIRLSGLVALVLGGMLFSSHPTALVPVHMLVGLVLVLSLWALSGMAASAGVSFGLVAAAVLWGLIVPVLGMAQLKLMPGSNHWVIQVVHLLFGLGAMGLGEALGGRLKRIRAAVA